jgi:hypothetical protein
MDYQDYHRELRAAKFVSILVKGFRDTEFEDAGPASAEPARN